MIGTFPVLHDIFTLWLFNMAMESDPFIDGLPLKNGGSFHGYVSHNQMVTHDNTLNYLNYTSSKQT